MKFIKKYYLLLLLIITLAGVTIYGTYAMFTSSLETDIVNMDTEMNYTFDINGTQQLKVSAGSKLRFNAIVKNSMDGKISYGMYYKMISPTTLPSGVIIAQVSDNLTVLAKGQLESGASKIVPMVIKNTSNREITVEIGVRTGYATASQGPDDIIYNDGEVPITSFQTSAEAGNDSCTATMECTTECTEKIENNMRVEYCYCKTGKKTPIVTRTSDEMLAYLGLKANTDRIPNFSKMATSNEGLFFTPDDYGTSYYFRGAVPNNYVKFAGYYWRIIRINGNGTIRMIYDGTKAYANRSFGSGNDRVIGESIFNGAADNAYVGYMYGQANANNYNTTHANINNSRIKTVVDNWYKTNIVDKGYSDKVADVIYCNDRSLYSGNGYASNTTTYSADRRSTPILTCPQKNDAFTVNDTSKGNGALTYPVGLITNDEVNMAGAVGNYSSRNFDFYLFIDWAYWTMTPKYYGLSGGASSFNVSAEGYYQMAYLNESWGVRPVISLKSGVTLTGSGTQNDPWVVQ